MPSPNPENGPIAWKDDDSWTRTLDEGLVVEATTSADSPVLHRFFEGYDRAFVLPDEREELAGFQKCLALNRDFRHAFGRTQCEVVTTLSNASGTLLGGANFLAVGLKSAPGAPPATIALNYVFVEAAARGSGLLRKAIALVRSLALQSVGLSPNPRLPPPAVFIEQNDPLRLSEEEYRRDTEHSGMDQVDRLAIWAKVGARIVDFPYVQPALSESQAPDDRLVYAAVDYAGTAVPAWVLHDHLESFFGISVLKGRSPSSDPVSLAQLAALSGKGEPIALLDPRQALLDLRENLPAVGGYPSLRSLIKKG